MSAVRRVVHTLKKLDFLHHDQATDLFSLGTAALTFVGGNIGNYELRDFVAPLMQDLADSSEVSVALGVRQHLSMVCIEARRSGALISLDMEVGMHLPLVRSAMGRAYLAACTDDERIALIEAIGESDGDSLLEVTPTIDRSLATYEMLGASCCFGEWQSDVNGIAVGFHPGHSLPPMAINCGAPAMLASREYLLNDVRPRLLHLVQRVLHEFGQISQSI
jgi:DNA-binding IclR family transcriptional regulator